MNFLFSTVLIKGNLGQKKVHSCQAHQRKIFEDLVSLKCYRFYQTLTTKGSDFEEISIGNSMISSDIWHKYHELYFKIVIRNFTSR